jgi:hypothetical protein
MPVLFDETPVVPVQSVDITETPNTSADGTNLGSIYQITLKGNLMAQPPGTSPVETEARLGVLLGKQAWLTELFNRKGKTLELYSPDGSGLTKCNPVLKSIQFPEGLWVDRSEYTIVLEAYNLYERDTSSPYVSDISDVWQIEENGFTIDNDLAVRPIWKMTRTVSAKGLLLYNEVGVLDVKPWERARTWTLSRAASPVFPFDGSGELNLSSTQAYNHTKVESVDIAQGGFTLTESWIWAYDQPAQEDFTISLKNSPDDAITNTVSIVGTIVGFANGINTLSDRILNATSYLNTVVKPNLFTRVTSAFPDLGLNPYGSNGSLDFQYSEGKITYNYEFNDRVGDANHYDTYTVSKKSSMDSREVSVTVSGIINGRLALGEANINLLKYNRAKEYFDSINNNTFMLTRAKLSGVLDLKPAYVGTSVDQNFTEGSITYSYEFNNRTDNKAKNDYTVESRATREDGRTTITVSGTITGLKEAESDPPSVKYENALEFFQAWVLQIPNVAAAFEPTVPLNPNPASRSKGSNVYNGVITYSYEYNTDPVPTIPGALSQNIKVTFGPGGQVIAIIPVIGRPDGPVLQDIGTIKERSKTITLDVVMEPGSDMPDTDDVINSYTPDGAQIYVNRDEKNWDETFYRFNRTVEWIYQ